jgi:hypothetical protein
MAGLQHHRLIARLLLAAILASAMVGSVASSPGSTASAASGWTGGVDLYRSGVFTTQKTWLWCTAADVQIMRNIARHAADHSSASQQRYFDYMRAQNGYRIPVSDGVDPAGWTAGLRHYVDGRYQLVASGSFDSALRGAVTNLRNTNLPVGITVSRGNHAWVLTGFTATADPATTSRFTVTSVRVVGPLWGLQSRTYGYDMRPDTKLTPAQLEGFFTPWHYARVKMAWEGRWVSVQPLGSSTPAIKPVPTAARPRAAPTTRPTAAQIPAAATVAPNPTATPAPSPTAEPTVAPVAVAAATPASSRPGGADLASPAPSPPIVDLAAVSLPGGLVVLVIGLVVLVLSGVALRARRQP